MSDTFPLVAGRFDRSIAAHVHSCLVLIGKEQRKLSQDNWVIATLCDAVRLARESDESIRAELQRVTEERDRLKEAVLLRLRAEQHNANCEECDGDGVPEDCPVCFPLFDDARLALRAAVAGDNVCEACFGDAVTKDIEGVPLCAGCKAELTQ